MEKTANKIISYFVLGQIIYIVDVKFKLLFLRALSHRHTVDIWSRMKRELISNKSTTIHHLFAPANTPFKIPNCECIYSYFEMALNSIEFQCARI